jgi:hypothetical protein
VQEGRPDVTGPYTSWMTIRAPAAPQTAASDARRGASGRREGRGSIGEKLAYAQRFAESAPVPSPRLTTGDKPSDRAEQERERRENYEGDDSASFQEVTSFPFLEAEVLERFCSVAIEPRGSAILSAARGEIALGDPRGGAVAGG